MNRPYSYTVLQYVHDVTSSEALNVGVVLLSEDKSFVEIRWSKDPYRLVRAFRDFQPRLFRIALSRLEESVKILERQLSLFPPRNATDIVRVAWPDVGLSYRCTEAKAGIAENFAKEVERLFERLVICQSPPKAPNSPPRERRMWGTLRKKLRDPKLLDAFTPAKVVLADQEVLEFEHTFRNGALHILESISFDLTDAKGIHEKAFRWLGRLEVLSREPDLGQFIAVVEKPTEPILSASYETSIGWLRQSSLSPTLYDIDETDALEKELSAIWHH